MDNRKKKMFWTLFPKLLIIGGLAAIAFSAYGFAQDLYTQRQSRQYYAALPPKSNNFPDEQGHTDELFTEILDEPPPLAALPEIATANEALIAEEAYEIDFEALRETIPDVVAWVYSKGAAIDYPVVQGYDNNHYLSRLPDGSKNKMGSIFLDYRNSPGFTDENSVIYGHHTKSGDMFSALENYKEQAFYDKHPLITLYTPEGSFSIKLFAGYVVDATKETLPRSFSGAADFEWYIEKIRKRSVFTSDVEVNIGDRLVSLCTCTYNFNNARFVLVGTFVKEGMP